MKCARALERSEPLFARKGKRNLIFADKIGQLMMAISEIAQCQTMELVGPSRSRKLARRFCQIDAITPQW